MPGESTRRDFLRMSAASLAATAAAGQAFGHSATVGEVAGAIEVWVTNQKTKCARATSIAWTQRSSTQAGSVIQLDPQLRFQSVQGFGAAFTDASCYMFNQLSVSAREQLFHELFHPSEMGLSVCRICVGSSDYSTGIYSFD